MVVKTTTGGSAWEELFYGGLRRGRHIVRGSIIQAGEWNHDDNYDTPDLMAISRSTDGGVSWTHHSINDTEGYLHSFAVHPGNSNIIYAGGQTVSNWKSCLFKTEDGGSTWSRLSETLFNDAYNIYALIIDPVNNNRILAGTDRGLYISEDGGENWTAPSSYLGIRCMAIDETNPDIVFAGTYNNFYISEDGGVSWTEHNTGLYEKAEIRCLAYNSVDNILYAGTGAGGVYRMSVTTAVEDPVLSTPESLILHRNYPNPFNNSTTISWTQPVSGDVTLSVYDIRGRKIRQLADAHETPGFKQVSWDGTDRNGRVMPSGIYICKLNFGAKTLSQKLILQK